MTIELLEPGLAVTKNRGYVGVGDPGDTIFFPHIDSCCGVVAIFEKGAIIGGHIGAQWPGSKHVDYAYSGNMIYTLMEANRQRVNAGDVTALISVFPRESSKWAPVITTMAQQWQVLTMLEVDTSNCSKGADVTVSVAGGVTVVDCKTNYSLNYKIPDDMEVKSEVFRTRETNPPPTAHARCVSPRIMPRPRGV